MPKGRGSQSRQRSPRQKRAVWVAKHGDVMKEHHERMVRMTAGRGVKGPCLAWHHPSHPHVRVSAVRDISRKSR